MYTSVISWVVIPVCHCLRTSAVENQLADICHSEPIQFSRSGYIAHYVVQDISSSYWFLTDWQRKRIDTGNH